MLTAKMRSLKHAIFAGYLRVESDREEMEVDSDRDDALGALGNRSADLGEVKEAMTKREGFKQLNVSAPIELYEGFHRIFPARGEKGTFFLRMMELAVEKGKNWSMVKQVQEEVEERYGKD